MHVDEDFADVAVFIFTGAQIHLVAANDGFLGIALAPRRQGGALRDHAFNDPLSDDLCLLGLGCLNNFGDGFFGVFNIIVKNLRI